MPAPSGIVFNLGHATATLDIAIVPVAGVAGNKRFTVGFTEAAVGFPSSPNVMEISIQEGGKSCTRVVTLESKKT